jgi:hypothetical protein
MREIRLSGSVEGVVSNHDPYSDPKASSSYSINPSIYLVVLNCLGRSLQVKRSNLQLPFYRYGRRWIASRPIAGLIPQFSDNRNCLRGREQRPGAISHFGNTDCDVLCDPEVAVENRHLFFNCLQIKRLGGRVSCGRYFNSGGAVQDELDRLVAPHSRRIHVNIRRKVDVCGQRDPATRDHGAIRL